jgi:hypothetical protein
MATVNKDFKIKSGLVVEGLQGTINGEVILTENAGDQYILDLIGGETLVKSVSNEFDVSVAGQLSIDRAVVDAYYDAAGDAADALTDANAYTDGRETAITNAYEAYADQAEVDAKAYTDNRETAITTAYESYADQAETDAKAYTDTREGLITTAYESYADDAADGALLGANTYTDNRELAITSAYESYADAAESDAVTTANAYTDTEIAALVDSAPALLDTLNELAAAIGDNPNYAVDLAASVGEKVAKAGDTMTGALTLSGAPTSNLHAATKAYVDTAETDAVSSANSYTDGEITTALSTAQGYANDAEADANSYTDGEITDALVTAQGYASDAQNNAQTFATNAINGLDTDDIEEGATNLYHTDARAKASAANLLLNASLTNIAITGNSTTGLIITAENGVADSILTDLAEGTTNLYFTDARAVDALEAVVPNFTAVELNSVAKQVAATLSAPTAGIQVAHAFAKADYRSAEYLVKVAYGTHTEISKVLLTLDSSDNIAITEYGIVGTNGSASSVSAGISGSNVQLQVTTVNNNSTVTVMGTLLK